MKKIWDVGGENSPGKFMVTLKNFGYETDEIAK